MCARWKTIANGQIRIRRLDLEKIAQDHLQLMMRS
jgi:hypothetical protein